MASTKLYTIIFVVLAALTTVQAWVEISGFLDQSYWLAFGILGVVASVKALMVAGYFQHLRSEPRSITYVYAAGLMAALALTVAAAYSIT
ncbi:hypothetical protein BRC81_14085 [Halobacteriales archaeon QS_1_68_20]|nr:MAG: hypothetical protein BRC81_14085 [Halobacteriales archaeon QS_1_68_20]